MKNTKTQSSYFDKIVKILKEIKRDDPSTDISRHLFMAITEYPENLFYLEDKGLYELLREYQTELEMNTLSTEDLVEIIENDDIYNVLDDEEYEDEDQDY